MSKIISILLLVSVSSKICYSQKFYFTPYYFNKLEVANNNNYDLDNYFKFSSPKFSSAGAGPFLIGANIEYEIGKHIFYTGYTHVDYANSRLNLEYKIKSTDPYTNFESLKYESNWAGTNVFKLPLGYKYELYPKQNKNIATNFKVRLNCGVNLLFINTKRPALQQPFSWGPQITTVGDTVEFVSYEGHNNFKNSISLFTGLDFDIYMKNKRRLSLQLFFEQGTRRISHSTYAAYFNGSNTYKFFVSSFSRGSTISFRLAFPIKIYDVQKQKELKNLVR